LGRSATGGRDIYIHVHAQFMHTFPDSPTNYAHNNYAATESAPVTVQLIYESVSRLVSH